MNWQTILIEIAAAVLAALGSWVLIKVKSLLTAKIKNQKAQTLLSNALDGIAAVVKATYQTFVEAIKGSPEWNAETQKQALQQATNAAQAQMSQEVKTYIQTNFGDVEKWIKAQIEATLYDLKNRK